MSIDEAKNLQTEKLKFLRLLPSVAEQLDLQGSHVDTLHEFKDSYDIVYERFFLCMTLLGLNVPMQSENTDAINFPKVK